MANKYSMEVIDKAINMKFKIKKGIYYTNPTTDKDNYEHKINVVDNNIVCDCKWSQINLKKNNKIMCSHALGVLKIIDNKRFWFEVSK